MELSMMTQEEKKEAFPVLLYNRRGNVSKTCHDLGVSAHMWRKWKGEDEEFVELCQDVTESLVDLGQDALIRNVEKGSSSDIQFLLKSLGRSRGYGEKVEIDHTGMIAHAHAHKWYPTEPKTVAEWEAQMIEAEQAQLTRAEQAQSEPNEPNEPLEESIDVPSEDVTAISDNEATECMPMTTA